MDIQHAIIVSDLSRCQPASALSERRARGVDASPV